MPNSSILDSFPQRKTLSACTAVASALLGYRLPSSGLGFLKLHINVYMEIVQFLELLNGSEP